VGRAHHGDGIHLQMRTIDSGITLAYSAGHMWSRPPQRHGFEEQYEKVSEHATFDLDAGETVRLDKLVSMYITRLNWHYYIVDAPIFERQLAEWNGLSFKALKAAPEGLSPDMQVFPAVLFQIAATSLLSLDERPDPDFDALKYAGNMTFEDLAVEYSEVGAAIVNLFGKKDLAVTTIQAEFLRASFLKFNKNVTESVSRACSSYEWV
jgi:hypothetical protein